MITERAMAGEYDFETSLRERVRLLPGLDESAVERARSKITSDSRGPGPSCGR